MQYTWQLALVLMHVYFIKHSVSCYIYYLRSQVCNKSHTVPSVLYYTVGKGRHDINSMRNPRFMQ